MVFITALAPEPSPPEFDFDAEATVAASFDRRVIADAPIAEVITPPEPPATALPTHASPADIFPDLPPAQATAQTAEPIAAPAPEPPPFETAAPILLEPEIAFSETEKPQKTKPEVKTVKVRNSVDVMAELEALRKRATSTTTAKNEMSRTGDKLPLLIGQSWRSNSAGTASQMP